MRIPLAISITLVIIIGCAEAPQLIPADFWITVRDGTLKLGQSEADAIKILGTPNHVRVASGYPRELRYLEYKTVVIGILQEHKIVQEFVLKKQGLATRKGIRVGDREKEVIARYGKGELAKGETPDTTYRSYAIHYQNDKPILCDYLSLSFVVRDGVVQEIVYNIAYDT